MAIKKENVSAIGLHLVPGTGDGVLAYSDGIADVEFEHINSSQEKGGMQSDINKELKEAIETEAGWYEDAE